LNQDRIADEVYADSMRSIALIEVNKYGFRYLLLQITKIIPLRRDAARAVRIVLPCHKLARLWIALNLKCNFFHQPDFSLFHKKLPRGHVIL
jgi:hypothetical protein